MPERYQWLCKSGDCVTALYRGKRYPGTVKKRVKYVNPRAYKISWADGTESTNYEHVLLPEMNPDQKRCKKPCQKPHQKPREKRTDRCKKPCQKPRQKPREKHTDRCKKPCEEPSQKQHLKTYQILKDAAKCSDVCHYNGIWSLLHCSKRTDAANGLLALSEPLY